MKNPSFKIIFLMCSFLVSSFVNAQSFEPLKINPTLSNECTEDGTDVFEPKTFKLSSGQVKLKTYSCMRHHQKQQRYYSVYGLEFNTKKTVYLQDKLYEAIGYVGSNANQVDTETVIFNSMAERGGDLVLIWVQDLNHVYNLKIPYMASDEGGVRFNTKNNQIYIQKVEALPGTDVKFKNKGKPIIFKKVKNKGIVFLSGDLNAFQN